MCEEVGLEVSQRCKRGCYVQTNKNGGIKIEWWWSSWLLVWDELP